MSEDGDAFVPHLDACFLLADPEERLVFTNGLDRHWRNARAHTTHDPLAYKFKFIGDFLLNGRIPPATAKF